MFSNTTVTLVDSVEYKPCYLKAQYEPFKYYTHPSPMQSLQWFDPIFLSALLLPHYTDTHTLDRVKRV